MNIKLPRAPKPVLKLVGRHALVLRKASPEILLVGGVVGVVTAGVMACRATLKVDEVLAQGEEKTKFIHAAPKSENYTEVEMTKDLAKLKVITARKLALLYVPAVGVGVLSIGMLVGSNRILSARYASAVAAYGALETGFAKYRQRVVDEFGQEKDYDFRYGKGLETYLDEKTGEQHQVIRGSENGTSIYARVFDKYSANWSKTPHYNQTFLKAQQQYMNDLLNARGHVFLNEVYDALGLERTPQGALVGWVKNGQGDNYVDFGFFTNGVHEAQRWINGDNDAILLDFNVDGIVYDKI